MVTALPSRLPGVYFEPEPPAVGEALPRMDVAAFVGVAASGPLDVPVAVEDPLRFREIFGPDVELAWDRETQSARRSLLGATVESFFANGGRRCFVVRVAERDEDVVSGTRAAVRHGFAVPGLVDATTEDGARLWARSEGSWCEGLEVSALEVPEPLDARMWIDGTIPTVIVTRPARPVLVGDLLRVWSGDGLAHGLFVVGQVTDGGGQQSLRPRWLQWYRTSRTPVGLVAQAVWRLDPDGRVSLPLPSGLVVGGRRWSLAYPTGALPEVEPGDLLRVEFDDGSIALLPITARVLGDGSADAELMAELPHHPFAGGGLVVAPANVDRLTMTLRVSRGGARVAELAGLGFTGEHARGWANLPSDRALYRALVSSWAEPVTGVLAEQVLSPRFPLAADPSRRGRDSLPIGMPSDPAALIGRGVEPHRLTGRRLERDGLAHFGAHLFVDSALGTLGATTLRVGAAHRDEVQHIPLVGVHATLGLEEVSVLAAPDAVHRPWQLSEPPAHERLGAPELLLTLPPGPGVLLEWMPVAGATSYRLEHDATPDFSRPSPILDASSPLSVEHGASCSERRYYRVRAARGGLVSPWSNTVTAVVPRREFRRCTAEVVVAPVLQLASAAPARVEWSAVGDATAYQLEEAAEPDFVGPIRWVVDPVTDGLGHDLALGPDRDRYYRVRGSADGQAGPWSNTILIAGGPSLPSYALDAPEDYLALGRAEILAIHRALLRCAATRGDASVLLSLPDHYRDADACAHRDALLHALDVPAAGPARVPPLAGEPEVVAYGGLYHPWVLRSLLDDVGSAARLPVDGAVAGLIARRTLSRGAWIAPANDPLVGVLGLWPEPDAALALAAHQAQVNRLVVAPRGVLNLSAMTLSLDGALRELTALRTLILVRRLVRREAPPHVFENNGAQLRTRIRDDFTRTLSRLWRAGGLAGRTATEAFEIVTDGRNNDRRGVEAGRLVVELHFAPTVPLSFLSVRLVEGSQGGAFVEVR